MLTGGAPVPLLLPYPCAATINGVCAVVRVCRSPWFSKHRLTFVCSPLPSFQEGTLGMCNGNTATQNASLYDSLMVCPSGGPTCTTVNPGNPPVPADLVICAPRRQRG